MDNITHSLVGAVLGQTGLKRRTGLAMPALVIAANLPDIDAPCAVYGIESLAMRRGISHGPIALLLLPLLLAAALVAFDRWQAGRGTRSEGRLPVRPGWVLALCYLGALTHPALDWLNNYGIRLLEPFSSRWFYGDALFIVDVWLWLMLAAGGWLSLKRERAGKAGWQRPAITTLCAALAYIGLNLAISSRSEAVATAELLRGRATASRPDGELLVVANAVPIAFWRREVLWRDAHAYGRGEFDAFSGRVSLDRLPHHMDDPRITAWAKDDPAASAFLFWSRMPVAELREDGILLKDQRFMREAMRANFSVELEPES